MKVTGTFVVFVLFLVFAAVSASYPPRGWELVERAPSSKMIRLAFALPHDSEHLMELFDDIALPEGKNYREFLSLEELSEHVRPLSIHILAVEKFLERSGAVEIDWSPGMEFVEFHISIKNAEEAFGTEFHHFRHIVSGRTVTRSHKSVELPTIIKRSVEIVMGLQDFFDSKTERKGPINREQAGTNAPYINMVMGSSSQAIVYFVGVCSDSSYATDPDTPCSGTDGGAITRFVIDVYPDGANDGIHFEVTPDEALCSGVDGGVICQVTANIPPYTRCSVKTQSYFETADPSQIYFYPTQYSPTDYITPQTVYQQYNVPRGTRATNLKSSQAVVSFEEQYYSEDDLTKFFKAVGLKQDLPISRGFNNGSMPGGEATLDVQWVMGIGQGVRTTAWSFPQEGQYILDWAVQISKTVDPPLVTSISYGDTEVGYQQKSGYGLAYIYRMNEELIKMALRGLTVIAGSGDAGWTNVGEMGNDLSNPDPDCSIGRAFYPSVSPYVMSLSSTFITKNYLDVCGEDITPVPGADQISAPIQCTGVIGEAPVSVSGGISWTTGGGFSNVTLRHSYQQEAVQYYLQTCDTLPPSTMFNRLGQGYADIATIGWNQLVVWDGVFFPIGGTSASGPVAAGLFALINDAMLNAGKKPIGFINPSLYDWSKRFPDAFYDITTGYNNDGDIQSPGSIYPTFCDNGFASQAGWDPVTGLGTPNFSRLRDLAVQFL